MKTDAPIREKNNENDLNESQVKRAFSRINCAHIKKLTFYNISVGYKQTDEGLTITAKSHATTDNKDYPGYQVERLVPWCDIIRNERDPIIRERYVALCDLLKLIEEN